MTWPVVILILGLALIVAAFLLGLATFGISGQTRDDGR